MKPENMKLLDLQTGKYLELGEKGFFYGGKTITCPPTKTFNIKNGDHDLTLHIYADTERDYDIECLDDSLCPQFQITIKSNNQKLIGSELGFIDMRFNRAIKQSEPKGILKTLCDKTGAVAYGGRYILMCCRTWITQDKISFELMYGDIFRNKYRKSDALLIQRENLHNFRESVAYYNHYLSSTLLKNRFKGNIFEEYSKQLRNEENKFDELMEKLN